MMILKRLVFAISLFLGGLASQAPEFAQQYRQRLGGAIDELRAIVERFDHDATTQNMTRDAAIERLRSNADSFVSGQAAAIRETVSREERLTRQLQGFIDAGPFARLGVMASDFDASVARRAWQAFEPAVPMTTEGLAAGFLGFVAGGGLLRLLIWPLTRRKPKPDAAHA